MTTVRKMVNVSCLDCERSFYLDYRPIEGQIINCPHCAAELEVISVNPLELDFYFEDSEADDEWEPYEDFEEEGSWEDDKS
jgi:lysine biosynthesis protein LysW